MPDVAVMSFVSMAMVVIAGFALGLIFYGGLWWTVQHLSDFQRPALVLLVGALLRLGSVLGGFYALARGEWSNLLLCLLGFVLARLAVTWATRLPKSAVPTSAIPTPAIPTQVQPNAPSTPAKASHAP